MKTIAFWAHALLIPTTFIGLFIVNPIICLAVVGGWLLSMAILNGCIITKWQRSKGYLPKNKRFVQELAEKVFNFKFSKMQLKFFVFFGRLLYVLIPLYRLLYANSQQIYWPM